MNVCDLAIDNTHVIVRRGFEEALSVVVSPLKLMSKDLLLS